MENKSIPHDCGEAFFEIQGKNGTRRFQCPKCGKVLRIKETIHIYPEWEDDPKQNI